MLRVILFTILFYTGILSHAHAKDSTAILLFGDSITAGYGLSNAESLPSQLEDLLQETHPEIRVINGSVSGDTTSGGRNRLAWTLDKYHPNLVVLALGGNDVLRGIPPELTRENLAAMLELLKTRDIPVVLSAVQAPENLGAEYENTINSLYPKLAKTYDIPLIPFLIAPTYGNPALMQADGIHPNAEGVKVIAKSLLPILLKHTSTL